MRNKNIISRSIQETLRIVDAKEDEKKHGECKLGCKYEFVDKEAQNAFNPRNATTSMMKCAHGHNHFGLRDSMTNNNVIEKCFPRYQSVETWGYVVKCNEMIDLRRGFIEKSLL